MARQPHVPDVPGGALRPAMDAPVGDDPAPDAGADLHEQQVIAVAPVRPVLAQGHDVHVVVDEHRRVVVAGAPLAGRGTRPAPPPRPRARPPPPGRPRPRGPPPPPPAPPRLTAPNH